MRDIDGVLLEQVLRGTVRVWAMAKLVSAVVVAIRQQGEAIRRDGEERENEGLVMERGREG